MLKKSKQKHLSPLETLPTRGVYTLAIRLNRQARLKVGKLGSFNFQKGYYAYSGSALGEGAVSLRGRVMRHLGKRKVKHWHIDFLLANSNASVEAVTAAESDVNEECKINSALMNIDGATVPIAGFGASDCKQNCRSHLVYIAPENATERIVKVYVNLFGVRARSTFLKR